MSFKTGVRRSALAKELMWNGAEYSLIGVDNFFEHQNNSRIGPLNKLTPPYLLFSKPLDRAEAVFSNSLGLV